jgi:hypothetical protein
MRFSNTTRPYVSCRQRYKIFFLVSPEVRCHRPFRHVMESSKCHLLLSFSLGRWFRSRQINAALTCPGEASGSMMAKGLAENKREVVVFGLSATGGLLRLFPPDDSRVSWNNLPRTYRVHSLHFHYFPSFPSVVPPKDSVPNRSVRYKEHVQQPTILFEM